ncbi:MAG: TRAP transporter substrate-binding protein [Acetobacteraceae bacterium]
MVGRRSFLMAGIGAGLTTGFNAVAEPARETVLRFGYISTRASQLGRGSQAFATEVGRLTGNRIRIEAYPNSELGAEADLLKAVADGTVDMAFITSAVLGSFLQPLGIFDIPFLFRDLPHARAVMDGPIGHEALASFEQRRVVGLAWGENGFRHLTTASRPVRSAADIQGIKIRVPQSEVMLTAFKAFGADAKPLAFNELFTALASGKFDAQENPISLIAASHFDAVQKTLTLTGHVYSPAVLAISKPVFEAFTRAEQASLRQAAWLGAAVSREQSELAERSGVEALRAAGMQVMTEYDRASFVTALASAEPAFVKLFGKDRIDAIRNVKAA